VCTTLLGPAARAHPLYAYADEQGVFGHLAATKELVVTPGQSLMLQRSGATEKDRESGATACARRWRNSSLEES